MTRVVFDTDVVLDAVLGRQPFYAVSLAALDWGTREPNEGFIAGHAVTTVYYVLRKQVGHVSSLAAIADLLSALGVASVTDTVLNRALMTGFGDFEDGVTHAAAIEVGADTIVTRNADDFGAAVMPVLSPATYIASAIIGNGRDVETP